MHWRWGWICGSSAVAPSQNGTGTQGFNDGGKDPPGTQGYPGGISNFFAAKVPFRQFLHLLTYPRMKKTIGAYSPGWEKTTQLLCPAASAVISQTETCRAALNGYIWSGTTFKKHSSFNYSCSCARHMAFYLQLKCHQLIFPFCSFPKLVLSPHFNILSCNGTRFFQRKSL